MIQIEIWGFPGSGKSTLAYYLTYRLKSAGIRAEFVGETAREHHIYPHSKGVCPPALLDNQVLVAGQQYERILRLQRHGIEVAVTDSPLIQGLLYCEDHFYYPELVALTRKLEKQFETYKVLVIPTPGCYDPESRVQRTEAEARALDGRVKELAGNDFWLQVAWGEQATLGDAVVQLATDKFIN